MKLCRILAIFTLFLIGTTLVYSEEKVAETEEAKGKLDVPVMFEKDD